MYKHDYFIISQYTNSQLWVPSTRRYYIYTLINGDTVCIVIHVSHVDLTFWSPIFLNNTEMSAISCFPIKCHISTSAPASSVFPVQLWGALSSRQTWLPVWTALSLSEWRDVPSRHRRVLLSRRLGGRTCTSFTPKTNECAFPLMGFFYFLFIFLFLTQSWNHHVELRMNIFYRHLILQFFHRKKV